MNTKDIIIKTIATLLWLWLIGYVIRLWTQQAVVVWSGPGTVNTAALVFCLLIGLFLIAAALYQELLPDNRRWLLLLGVGLIWSAHVHLVDDPSTMVYLQDIMKLFWVFFVIMWPTKLLISEKQKEANFEKEVEIIEV